MNDRTEPMEKEWRLTEHYPDGGTWTHWYWTLRDAQWAQEDLEEAHPGRKYVIDCRTTMERS